MFGMYLCFLDSKNDPSRESALVVSIFPLRMWTFAVEISRFTHWVLPFPVIVVYWHTLFHSVSLSLTLRKEVLLLVRLASNHLMHGFGPVFSGFAQANNSGYYHSLSLRMIHRGFRYLEGFQNPGSSSARSASGNIGYCWDVRRFVNLPEHQFKIKAFSPE